MRAGQLESGPVVVECGWFPSCCCVALRAVGAECAVVSIILAVAIHTVLRCALEHAVDMALSASHTDVRAGQLESGTIVIERGWLPPCRCVALRAIRAELAVVRIILAVTVHTVLRRALEHAVDVTPSASHIDVGADQLESGPVVIERGWLPADRRMALRAIRAELAVVRIIFAMTVHAHLWSTLEELIRMAPGAGRVRMLTNELEDGLVMVEGGRLPTCRRVALNTLRAKRALMGIVLTVTVHTCLRGALEELVSMASGAGLACVLAGELEDRSVVVECGRLPSCRRVALNALRAERTLMGIVLAVTVHARL
jgi:putative component of membrane protein insertase Oxa1/YidC/SpoIIIJ protein YidD